MGLSVRIFIVEEDDMVRSALSYDADIDRGLGNSTSF